MTGLTAASLPSGSPVGLGEETRRGVPQLTCGASELGRATRKEPKHAIRDKQGRSLSPDVAIR